jgi:hypothetical protein
MMRSSAGFPPRFRHQAALYNADTPLAVLEVADQRNTMMKLTMLAFGVFAMVGFGAVAAQAQGVPGGVAHGVAEGNDRAGPVGAVVGGVVGGVIGGVQGVLGVDPRPATEARYASADTQGYRRQRFHRHHASRRSRHDLWIHRH